MDWKIPVTIIILIAVVSMGFLPFVSPEISDSVVGIFSPVKDFFTGLLNRGEKFEGNGVKLSLITTDFPGLKIGSPTDIVLSFSGDYKLKVDGKDLTVKKQVLLQNFTGDIKFDSFLISGTVLGISSEDFEFEGNLKIRAEDQNFNEISLSEIRMGEIIVNKGTLSVSEPQKIDADIQETTRIYNFKGMLEYRDDTAVFEGSCSKIQTKSFTLGDTFQLGDLNP